MSSIFDFFLKDKIGEPPWSYDFLLNLDESEYPLYLAKIFKYRTGEDLPLKKLGSLEARQLGGCNMGKAFFNLFNKERDEEKAYPCGRGQWVIDKEKCKTFNQKIQWIKLCGITDLMRMCTDKVAVRDYVAEKIGSEYLKPVLQIIPDINHPTACRSDEEIDELRTTPPPAGEGRKSTRGTSVRFSGEGSALADNNDPSTYFDQIDFNKLPDQFVLKCNHGCKWHYIIKNKTTLLSQKKLYKVIKRQMTDWLQQEYWIFGGFEMQYSIAAWKFGSLAAWKRGSLKSGKCGGLEDNEVQSCKKSNYITPKILIEPLLRKDINTENEGIHVYCFNGEPKFSIRFEISLYQITVYDENLTIMDIVLSEGDENIKRPADNLLKQAVELSKKLSKDFIFVRVDWMIFQNHLYLEELTFTPHSGSHKYKDKEFYSLLSKLLDIERL